MFSFESWSTNSKSFGGFTEGAMFPLRNVFLLISKTTRKRDQ